MIAGPLMVCDTETSPRFIPSKSNSISFNEETLTPHFPTSPSENGWSGS